MGTFVTASPHVPLPANKVDGPNNPPTGKTDELDASDFNSTQGAANDLFTHANAWVNVLSYGAKGDGVTDDAPAIQLALNAAAGRKLHFPKGTYLLNSYGTAFDTLDFVFGLSSGTHMRGEPGAKLKIADGLIGRSTNTNKGNIFLAVNAQDITIESLEIDFNGENNLATQPIWLVYGLYAVNTSNIIIRDCYWHDTPGTNYVITYGVAASLMPSATGLLVDNCEFLNGGTSLPGNTTQTDFSAVYSTNFFTRVTNCHIHHTVRPFTFCGGVELHASDSQVSGCTIEDSYPAVYLGSTPSTLNHMAVVNNNFNNCHSGVIFPAGTSGSGDYDHINISGNICTLLRLSALSTGFISRFIDQSVPALNGSSVDWTNYPFTIKRLNIIGNTVESLNGTQTDLFTDGILLSSVFGVAIEGNQFYNLSGPCFLLIGSPYGSNHINFSGNVCVDWGNHSHVSNPHIPVGIQLAGSSDTPSVAAFSADNIMVSGNSFVRSSLVSNTGMIYTAFDSGSTLTNWACINNIAENAGALAYGTTITATPVLDSFATSVSVTATPATLTLLQTDVFVNVASAATVNLPATPSAGKTYVIKDTSGAAGTNHITVSPPGGGTTIDGSTSSLTISSNYGVIRLVGDGTNYWTM